VPTPSWAVSKSSVKKFPTFYKTQRFISVFIRGYHWSVSLTTYIKSPPSHAISFKIYLHVILPSTPSLPVSFLLSYNQNPVCWGDSAHCVISSKAIIPTTTSNKTYTYLRYNPATCFSFSKSHIYIYIYIQTSFTFIPLYFNLWLS
jgi:hypothetical protein